MTEIAESLNILETCCFPKGCCIEKESQQYLALVLVPKLKALGMSVSQYTLGALNLEEPHLTKVKSVVCRGCAHFECIHNPRAGQDEAHASLLKCSYGDRQVKNAELLNTLFPEEKIKEWSGAGITVGTFIISSRTRVHVSIRVAIGGTEKANIVVTYSSRKKDVQVWKQNPDNYPLPTSTDEIRVLLHRIIESFA